jgi:hypothetical protein
MSKAAIPFALLVAALLVSSTPVFKIIIGGNHVVVE